MTSIVDDARGELRKVCHAGGDLGCSCADRNYQWFDHACREQIVTAFKNMLNAQAFSAAPARCDAGSARVAVIEECAKVAEAQAKTFLSPQYASNQPLGSLCERFACEEVARAIRALAIPSADRGTP